MSLSLEERLSEKDALWREELLLMHYQNIAPLIKLILWKKVQLIKVQKHQ